MDNNKVNFLRGTSAEYESKTKDNDTFYYTTDDKKLYLGETEITSDGVTIDNALSDTSEHPVQNKVINAALNGKANMSDIPTSLPANGGNADIAKYIGTWGSPEQYYGEQLKMRALYNKFGDLRFVLTTDTDNEIRVDYATNADTLDGKHAENFMQWLGTPGDTGFMNDANYKVDYHCNIGDGTIIGLPIAGWYHIVYYMHSNLNGFGMQIAYPLNFDGATMIRRAVDTTWGDWKNVADGGNAMSANHQIQHRLPDGTDVLTYATSGNCPLNVNTKVRIMHSPTCPTNYGYDAANNDFWYDIYRLDNNSWVTIKAYDVRGNAEFINSCCNGTWSGWVRSNDGGNATTLGTHPASDFLYANGFAGQLAKLFSQPVSSDELATLFSVVPDNASLDKLAPGIYVVSTSAARNSLGIPQKSSISGPPTVNGDSYIRMGGILIKFGSVFSSPNFYGGQGYGVYSNPVPFAFFIDSGGVMYRASCSVFKSGSSFTHNWEWSTLVTDEFDLNHIIIDDIVYLSKDVTIPTGSAYNIYLRRGMYQRPCKSGIAYGPSTSYGLTLNDSGDYLAIKNSKSSNMILPAGRYLITTR